MRIWYKILNMSVNKCSENIKCLIPKPKTPLIKPPMYRSIYTESVRRTYMTNKDRHRTMGYSEVQLDPPEQFLKKNTRKVTRPFVDKTDRVECNKKIAGRPKFDYCVVGVPKKPASAVAEPVERKTQKNILRTNIIDVIHKVPPLSKHRVQDTRNGHVIVLNEAGLEPIHVFKKNYGRTPAYIKKMYKENETARLAEDERIRTIKPPLRLLPDDERNELLNGLKTNWATLHTEFLLLPMLTDTMPKVKRKTMLEKELNNLEKDIDLLERNPSIYVCQDS